MPPHGTLVLNWNRPDSVLCAGTILAQKWLFLAQKCFFLLKNGPFKVLIAERGRPRDVAIFHLIVKLHFQEKISSGTTAHLMLEPFFLKNGCFCVVNQN